MNSADAPLIARRFSLPLLLRAVGRYRKYLLLAGLFFAAACFALLQIFDNLAARHRELVQQELHRILGKDVNFEGIEATLWGGLGFVAKDFRIDDDRRFAATPFLYAKALHLGLSVLDLARGRLVIDSLTLKEPEFQIIADESGLLNVTALVERKKALSTFPRIAATAPGKQHDRVNFTIRTIQIADGQLYCVDRSRNSTATLKIRNVQMSATGLGVASSIRLKITGALTEGLTQDMTIHGTVSAPPQPELWAQRQLDLDLRFDSLQLPMVIAALPGLKDNLLSKLGITAPSTLRARLTGTLRQPVLSEALLKVPLFGATEYNAVAEGSVRIPEDRNWANSAVEGKLKLSGVDLVHLRRLSFLKNVFSPRLQASGPVKIVSNLAGTWPLLRVGARIDASAAELYDNEHIRKRAGVRAIWQGQFARQESDLAVHDSTLFLGELATDLVGRLSPTTVDLHARKGRGQLAALVDLLARLPNHTVTGVASWDLRLHKDLYDSDNPWELHGALRLTDAKLQPQRAGEPVEIRNGTLTFAGAQAHAKGVPVRYGSSPLILDVILTDLGLSRGTFRAHSQALHANDLVPLFSNSANSLRNFVADGNFELHDATPSLSANISAAEGMLEDLPFQDLRAELHWSPGDTRVKHLSFRAFDGTVRAHGGWIGAGQTASQTIEWSPRVEAIDLTTLVKRKFPNLTTRVAGRLDFRGHIAGTYTNSASAEHSLTGTGEAQISNGFIKDFNLVAQLFGVGSRNPPASRLPAGLQRLVERRETAFDNFKGSFTFNPERLSTDNLILATPDYTITGAGWVAQDRTTRWNGLLVLSPAITQELQREYKMLRYFVDRRGRLSIAFKVDGTLPNVRIRPDNRALAQALRWGTAPRGGSSGADNKKKDEWLPRSLEDILR